MNLESNASPDAVLEAGRHVLRQQGFSRLVGTELLDFGQGHVELELLIREDHSQQHGFVHGGVICYLADLALTMVGGSMLGGMVLTSELKINYVRPGVGERLIARGHGLHAGRTQAVTRCEIFAVADGQEKLCAAAQGTIVRVPAEKLSDKTAKPGG